ncbi:MAG: YwiC-like family protein [Betaproteobacteria bacterium]
MEKNRQGGVPWKAIALPVEHGGWGFLAEPVVLGLVLAPSVAGALLALAALAGFLCRHPLRLALLDRRRGVRYPRTAWAERFLAGYAGLALLLLAAAFTVARSPFWPALAAAAPIGIVALAFDALGRSREVLPEATGAVALGASATAIALAGGAAAGLAWGAWALLALRAASSVLYVRARIRLDRGLAAGPRLVLAGHALALAAAAGLARSHWAPWLASAAFLVLLGRAAWGLSPWRRRVRPQALGYQELGFGVLTLALLTLGYRLGP